MRKFRSIALICAGFASAAYADEIKIGYQLDRESHFGVGAVAFEKAITEHLGDSFSFRHFPSAGLGGERETIEGLQLGTVEMTIVSDGALTNFVPEVGVLSIPFLLRDTDHARKVLDGDIGQELLGKFDASGVHALAWSEQGFRHTTNNVRPITGPSDVVGLKLRTMENPVHIAAFRALGVAPTPMAWPEVIGALEQGAIDGQENPLAVIVSAKLNEVQKYLSLDGHVYSSSIILVSPSLWERLDETQRAAFELAAKEAVVAMRTFVEDVEADGVQTMQDAGMAVNEVTPEARAEFRAVLAQTYKDYEAQFGKDLMDRIMAVE